MKKAYLSGLVFVVLAMSCGSKSQKTLADYYEAHPGQTELTATKHVKARTKTDNRERVKYYNSIQHR
jgi:hypothetical protein